VRVVANKKANSARYSSVTYLANNEVPVRLDGHYAIMHDKVMLFDGVTLQTGSFNYTKAGEPLNSENALLLQDMPEVASVYLRHWQFCWDKGQE